MSTDINTIIANIKDVALNQASFASVEELKVNPRSISDTELDKLFIKLINIDYDNFIVNTVDEKYIIELIIIIGYTNNPISSLKSKIDLLLNKLFTINDLFTTLLNNNKVRLISANLTNDIGLYSKYSGEGVTLRMEINNKNSLTT